MRPALHFVAAQGAWHGKLSAADFDLAEDLDLAVDGDASGPFPGLADVLWRIVDDWPACRRAVEAFTAALPPGGKISFAPRPDWAFAVSDCGFDRISFASLVVKDLRPRLTVYTGLPDGYACFDVLLDGIQPVSITASCW